MASDILAVRPVAANLLAEWLILLGGGKSGDISQRF